MRDRFTFIACICLLFIFSLKGFAQIDSLKNELKKMQPDTQRIRIFKELSFHFARVDTRQAIPYCDSVQKYAVRINKPKYHGMAAFAKANIYINQSLYDKSIQAYKLSNQYYKGIDEMQIGLNYSDMAFCYYSTGSSDSFFYYSIKAIKIFETYKREDKVGKTYSNMAYIFTELEKFDDARKYFKLSNEIFKRVDDQKSVSKNLHNQGVMYEYLSMYDSALYFYSEALALKQKLGDSLAMATSYSGIAQMYMAKGQFDLFLTNMNRSISLGKRVSSSAIMANGYYAIGEGYFKIGKTDSCVAYLNRSLKIDLEIGDKRRISDCYKLLADCYFQKGDYKSAFEKFKLNKAYSDSLFNEESNDKMEELKIGFETEKKEQENKELQLENDLSTKAIKQQKLITYFIIGALLLLVIFAVYVMKSLKQQRKANKIISEQKEEVENAKALVDEHQKEILDSIHYAKRIQNTLLAHKGFVDEHIKENFIYFKPKDIVSGDFYWAAKNGDNFYIAACDSTGHGVPGAFMSLLNINFLNEAINEKDILEPDKILNFVRKRLISSISKDGQKDGFDGILLRLNEDRKEITYAAANNAPVLVSNGVYTELDADRMPVGEGERREDFKLFTISSKPGDTLYLYTDGYADQFGGPKGKKYKYKPLNELLLKISNEAFEEQTKILDDNFSQWKGNLEQVDDVCLIGIRL